MPPLPQLSAPNCASARFDFMACTALRWEALDRPFLARFNVARDRVVSLLQRGERPLRQAFRPVHHCVTPFHATSLRRSALLFLPTWRRPSGSRSRRSGRPASPADTVVTGARVS